VPDKLEHAFSLSAGAHFEKICNSCLPVLHHGNPKQFPRNPTHSTTSGVLQTNWLSPCRGFRAVVVILVLPLLWAVSAFASLGGDIASVQADATQMQAHVQSARHADYTLHEMQSASGTAVREYVSSSGTVFAVAWKGTYPPNLKQLLGSQFAQYQDAMRNSSGRAGRGPMTIQLSNLVVQLSGHMGDYSGRAYIPDKVPAGTSLESIR